MFNFKKGEVVGNTSVVNTPSPDSLFSFTKEEPRLSANVFTSNADGTVQNLATPMRDPEEIGFWEKFKYGYNKTKNDWQYVGDIWDATWGDTRPDVEGWGEMSFDQRREYIKQEHNEYVESAYSDLVNMSEEDLGWVATTFGALAKHLSSPINYIPGLATLKLAKGAGTAAKLARASMISPKGSVVANAWKAGAVGGAWGAEYSALEQLALEGKVIPKEVLVDSAIAAASNTVLFGGGYGLKYVADKRSASKAMRVASSGSEKQKRKLFPNPVLLSIWCVGLR